MTAPERILITGASSGIGACIARQLAAAGAREMILTGRRSEGLAETADGIDPAVDISRVVADLTLAEARQDLISRIPSDGLDALILNAGGGPFGLFVDSNRDDNLATIALNITANVELSHALLPAMLHRARTRGTRARLIFVSSHAAFMRVPHFAVYASAKAFMNHFASILMQELADDPIDVSVVCPGATETRFASRAGIPPMLTGPMAPNKVALQVCRKLGTPGIHLTRPFDRLVYLMQKLLPRRLVDGMIRRAQRRFLSRPPVEAPHA